MTDIDQQIRLQRFWGVAIFSLGILWGLVNLVYSPIAALTSIAGSSWYEGFIVVAGGLLTLGGSIGAFYRRRAASRVLLLGGVLLLFAAGAGQVLFQNDTRGAANLLLLFLSGAVAVSLGVFGEITEHRRWPGLLGGM